MADEELHHHDPDIEPCVHPCPLAPDYDADKRWWVLGAEGWAELREMLDREPQEKPALRALMAEHDRNSRDGGSDD